jgi:signal peptidase I
MDANKKERPDLPRGKEMDKKLLKNPWIQGGLLVLALILYLISPNDGWRFIFGLAVALIIVGLVVFEVKEGAKEHGWKNEVKDTLITLIAAVVIWYAAQFLLNTTSPVSAVVTCSMLPNLQRGDFAIVQGAPINAYELEMTSAQIEQLKNNDAKFTFDGTEYSVKGSIYSSCIYSSQQNKPAYCNGLISDPTAIIETKGPLTFYYAACSMAIRDRGTIVEPCVISVDYNGKNYPIRLTNDVLVYQPNKAEVYSLSGDIIHRAYFKIKEIDTGKYYYLTKGDNNQVLDVQVWDYVRNMGNYPISQEQVKGRLLFQIPYLGYYKLLLSGFFTEPMQCKMQLSYPHN